MSKCKAVLDGDKITEIRVKAKAQGSQMQDDRKLEGFERSKSDDLSATQQQSK